MADSLHISFASGEQIIVLFCSGRIRTLVGKEEIDNFFLSQWGYLDFFTEIFIEYYVH